MSNKKSKPSQPPQPPPVSRKLQFHRVQMIGVPLMMLIPVLALFGLFGETVNSVDASSTPLEMRVEYPTRFRYKMIDSIRVSLFNKSDQPLATVQVGFDRAYIEGFSTVTFTPSVKHITDSFYFVEVNDLQPGETRIISVTIQAEKYGKHQGTITADPENSDALEVSIATFTFP